MLTRSKRIRHSCRQRESRITSRPGKELSASERQSEQLKGVWNAESAPYTPGSLRLAADGRRSSRCHGPCKTGNICPGQERRAPHPAFRGGRGDVALEHRDRTRARSSPASAVGHADGLVGARPARSRARWCAHAPFAISRTFSFVAAPAAPVRGSCGRRVIEAVTRESRRSALRIRRSTCDGQRDPQRAAAGDLLERGRLGEPGRARDADVRRVADGAGPVAARGHADAGAYGSADGSRPTR